MTRIASTQSPAILPHCDWPEQLPDKKWLDYDYYSHGTSLLDQDSFHQTSQHSFKPTKRHALLRPNEAKSQSPVCYIRLRTLKSLRQQENVAYW